MTSNVCFKGGIGNGACPGPPLTNLSVFAEDPQSREFPVPLQWFRNPGMMSNFLVGRGVEIIKKSLNSLIGVSLSQQFIVFDNHFDLKGKQL